MPPRRPRGCCPRQCQGTWRNPRPSSRLTRSAPSRIAGQMREPSSRKAASAIPDGAQTAVVFACSNGQEKPELARDRVTDGDGEDREQSHLRLHGHPGSTFPSRGPPPHWTKVQYLPLVRALLYYARADARAPAIEGDRELFMPTMRLAATKFQAIPPVRVRQFANRAEVARRVDPHLGCDRTVQVPTPRRLAGANP